MKLLLALAFIVGLYTFMLIHTTNIVLGQTQRLNDTYQYVANHSDQIVGVKTATP